MADQAPADPWIGKFVVVRTTQAGVHAGRLVSHDGQNAELAASRRLWYWKVANKGAFLSGVAAEGLDYSVSKVGAPIDVRLTDVCEVIPCNEAAEQNIAAAPTYEVR